MLLSVLLQTWSTMNLPSFRKTGTHFLTVIKIDSLKKSRKPPVLQQQNQLSIQTSQRGNTNNIVTLWRMFSMYKLCLCTYKRWRNVIYSSINKIIWSYILVIDSTVECKIKSTFIPEKLGYVFNSLVISFIKYSIVSITKEVKSHILIFKSIIAIVSSDVASIKSLVSKSSIGKNNIWLSLKYWDKFFFLYQKATCND